MTIKYARQYYAGLVKDYRHPNRVKLQLRQSVDCLSCECWRYLGELVTTKIKIKANRRELLEAINQKYDKQFDKLIID